MMGKGPEEGDFGCWIFPRGCGPDAGRGRDTVRVDFGFLIIGEFEGENVRR